MLREQLKLLYLPNSFLIQAIEAKQNVHNKMRDIETAIKTCESLSLNVSADSLREKLAECRKVKEAYSNMLEDVWGVTWQKEMIIEKHIGKSANEIDALPENLHL